MRFLEAGTLGESFAERLASRIVEVDRRGLPREAVEAVRVRLVDTLGCALGACGSEHRPDVDRILGSLREPGRVHVVGGAVTGSIAAAGFANVALARYLDFNDTCLGAKDSCHPSDSIPGLLSLAEEIDAPGDRLLEAVVATYGTMTWLADRCSLRDGGWDSNLLDGPGAAAGACKLLGLSVEQTSHALSIIAVDNAALLQTRVGQLSQWKAFAAASIVRRGLVSAQLAAAGVTGPEAAFEGKHGFFRQLCFGFPHDLVEDGSGEPFDLQLGAEVWKRAVQGTHLKAYPVQIFSQSGVDAGLRLRARGVAPERVERIRVKAYHDLVRSAAAEPAKWRPTTRETADHSLPFCLAAALMAGELTDEQFRPEFLADQQLIELMDRVEVQEDREVTRRYPERMDVVAEAELRDGGRVVERVEYPLGHVKRPMSIGEVLGKFASQAEAAGVNSEPVWDLAWNVVDAPSVRPLMASLAK